MTKYRYEVVTGRYKIYDSNGVQIATADSQEDAELIVKALNQYVYGYV